MAKQHAEYEFSEKDWKLLRKKLPAWQEAWMDRLIEEYRDILDREGASSGKFWTLYERLKTDQKSPGVAVEDLRRSRMEYTIRDLLDHDVICMDDLSEFSEELKEYLK